MSKALLKISPGPFLPSGPLGPMALTALALSPWLMLLALGGFFWPFLAPLAALTYLALSKKTRPNQKKAWAEISLFSILGAILLGPTAGPLPYLAAGLSLSIIKTKSRLFRQAFLPAALVGGLVNLAQNFSPIQNLAAHLNLSHFLSLAPSPAPVTGLWLLTLIPAALTSLLTKRQRLQNSLIPLLVWTLAAALLLAASHQPFDWSWGLIWLVLAFHLGREFWPSQNNLKGPLLVTLAGLAPLLAPWAFWPALALLSALEITLSLISLRRAKIMAQKDAPTEPPAPNLDLVAIRLCSRPQVSEMAIYQGPPGCRLAAALDSGPQECPEGCLSLGDCVAGCPHGAIKAAGPGLIPKLDKTRCRGCGACLPICPKGLLVLRPREASFVVTCRGSAKLKDMDSLCPVGCLKCGRCRKACPAGAIDRLGQLAPPQVSDQLCQKALPDCGLSCRSACPRSLPGPAMGLFSP